VRWTRCSGSSRVGFAARCAASPLTSPELREERRVRQRWAVFARRWRGWPQLVIAPQSSWRRHVVALAHGNLPANEGAKVAACRRGTARGPDANSDAPLVPPGLVESGEPAARGARVQAAVSLPAEITVARDARIDWATLLKRVHEIDALACTCGGRLSVRQRYDVTTLRRYGSTSSSLASCGNRWT
jgi:hypothetical protein